MFKMICENCNTIFEENKRGYKYCPICRNLTRFQKKKRSSNMKEKCDWDKIIETSKNTGMSYGELVQKGMI